MKQKVLQEHGAFEMQNALNVALQYGWIVQSVTCNAGTDMWIAVLTKE